MGEGGIRYDILQKYICKMPSTDSFTTIVRIWNGHITYLIWVFKKKLRGGVKHDIQYLTKTMVGDQRPSPVLVTVTVDKKVVHASFQAGRRPVRKLGDIMI